MDGCEQRIEQADRRWEAKIGHQAAIVGSNRTNAFRGIVETRLTAARVAQQEMKRFAERGPAKPATDGNAARTVWVALLLERAHGYREQKDG
jgi:hypothetical protein